VARKDKNSVGGANAGGGASAAAQAVRRLSKTALIIY
jgi:hypothetical protein